MYTDPLHIPSADYTLWHDGKEALTLNKRLLDQQNCWTNVTRILELHSERLHLEDMMKEALNEYDYRVLILNEDETQAEDAVQGFLMLCDAYYTQIEFELQEQWGFTLDSKFHRHWYRPGCTCPKMDNDDWYPTGRTVINGDCLLHGYTAPPVPPTLWEKIVAFFKGVLNG